MLAVNVANSGGWGVFLFVRWWEGLDQSPVSYVSSTVGALLALLGLGLTYGRYEKASGWILVATSLSSTIFSGFYLEPERSGLALFFLSVPVAVAALMISGRAGLLTFGLALTGWAAVMIARPELPVAVSVPPVGFLVYLSTIIIVATVVKERLEMAHEAKLAESAKMASLGLMSAGIAHEINNPLFVLNVSSTLLQELLLEEPLDRKRILDLGRKITEMTERIDQTVKGLKSFAREASADPMRDTPARDVLAETRSSAVTGSPLPASI